MQSLFYKEISKKLTAETGGNCEYDPACVYGFGTKQCSAGEKVIEEKFDVCKREVRTEHPDLIGGVFPCSRDMAAWPCSMFQIVSFSDPPKAKTLKAEI